MMYKLATHIRYVVLLMSFFGMTSIHSSAQTPGYDHFKQGKLSNGLTYYILNDGTQSESIHYYFFQNVGSIVEQKGEMGMAHFLEHLAFNATKHFPGGIMNFFDRHKIEGYDARTGLEQTSYQINFIPKKDEALNDSILLILHDWCTGVSITPSDIEKERSIIYEEMLHTGGYTKQLQQAIAPYIYNHSTHAEHNTIGTRESLAKFDVKSLRRFYNAWYRPDLQFIAIIGDLDVDAVEAKVKSLFDYSPRGKNFPPRVEYSIPTHAEPLVYAYVNPQNGIDSYGIYERIRVSVAESDDYISEGLYEQLFNRLLTRRIAMLRNSGNEEYIAASGAYQPLVRNYKQIAWDIVPYEGHASEAMTQILQLRNQLVQEGFTQAEFDAVQEKIYNGMVEVLSNGGNLNAPDNVMEVFRQNYLYKMPVTSLNQQLKDNSEALLSIDLEGLNEWMKNRISDDNLAMIFYTTDATKAKAWTVAEAKRLLDEGKGTKYLADIHKAPISKLIDFDIKPGKIVKERPIEELEATELILSNGARVIYRRIPEFAGRFYFMGFSQGGESVVKPEDIPTFRTMRSLVMQSGVYKYDRNQLAEWLAPKDFDLSLSASDYTEGVSGQGSSEDIEPFFSYLYLVLTKQNFYPDVVAKHLQRQRYIASTHAESETSQLEETIAELLYPTTPFNPKEDNAFYDRVKADELGRLFTERLANAADFTYCIIGDIDTDKVRELITTYLATLPASPLEHKESYVLRDRNATDKTISREFISNSTDNVGDVEITYIYDNALSERESALFDLVPDLLQVVLLRELREKEHGVYTVGVRGSSEEPPVKRSTLSIHFRTERPRVEYLKQKVYTILEQFDQGDIPIEDFAHILSSYSSSNQATDEPGDLGKWFIKLDTYLKSGAVPEEEGKASSVNPYDGITPQEVGGFLRKLRAESRHREIVVKSKVSDLTSHHQ